jgi:hypothetical protein
MAGVHFNSLVGCAPQIYLRSDTNAATDIPRRSKLPRIFHRIADVVLGNRFDASSPVVQNFIQNRVSVFAG